MADDPVPDFCAVVLSGGRGSRLGGRDKSRVVVEGRPMLEPVLASLAAAREIVVAGAAAPAPAGVRFVREDPPWGGPVAGLYAALDSLASPAPLVAVVAVDMPWLTGDTIARLVAACAGRDGAALVDPDGVRQLCLVVRHEALVRLRPDSADGFAVRRLLAPLDVAEVTGSGREAYDVDEPGDIV